MAERKSGRSRKSVDYTTFGAREDSDDDFADSTPPVSKKQKLSNKENKTKKNEKPPQLKKEKEPTPKRARPSLQEKLFDRELQAALELSLSQSEHSQESTVTKATREADDPVVMDSEDDNRSPSPIVPTIVSPPVLSKAAHSDDDIQVLETGLDVIPSSRKRVAQAKKYVDSDDAEDADSDFAVEEDVGSLGEDDSDDDDDDDFNAEDSDSDFGGGKNMKESGRKNTSTPKAKTKTTKQTVTSMVPKVTSAVAKTTKTTPVARKPMASKTNPAGSVRPLVVTKSPAISSPAGRPTTTGPTAIKTPSWSAPGPSSASKSPLGGLNLKSPSSGLRIGLSRNIRLKPLHPNIKIHN